MLETVLRRIEKEIRLVKKYRCENIFYKQYQVCKYLSDRNVPYYFRGTANNSYLKHSFI